MRAVLCYHKVGLESAEGRWINIAPETLRKHIEFFQRRSYGILPAARIFDVGVDRAISLTFDDAFSSMLANGLPVLERLKVPATIYAVSDRVGQTADWEGGQGESLANWDDLREAQKRGMEIGNHTATHASFGKLDFESQVEEIHRCHERLVAEGLNPKTFCLPYGHYSAETSTAIKEAGYRIGFTVEKRYVSLKDDPCLLPRFAMSYGDSVPGLMYKLFVRPRILGNKVGK
ncbi:MAG: polysaccharide deacetylase family protein [Fimbriimonadaceae bacterium]